MTFITFLRCFILILPNKFLKNLYKIILRKNKQMIKKNIKNFISMIRIDHWFKNIFVIPGIIFALLLTNNTFQIEKIIYYLSLIFSVCLIASANYLINEFLDSKFDKYHPSKKYRPLLIIILNYFIY